jgi:branched-chain amino acid transport system substrate-binding protein
MAAALAGWQGAKMLVRVLTQCGDDLSRENVMRQAANLKDFELPIFLPGIKINTSPDNYCPFGKRIWFASTARAGSCSAT